MDKPIKCRDCEVPAQVFIPDDEAKPNLVVCPRCGAEDDLDVVVASLGDQAAAFAAKEFEKALGGKSSRAKGGMLDVSLSFSPAKIDQARTKFVVDI